MNKLIKNVTTGFLIGGVGGYAAANPKEFSLQDEKPTASRADNLKKRSGVDTLSIAERNQLIRDSILVMLQNNWLSKLVQDVPGIGFSTGKPGEYAAGAAAVNYASIHQVRIDTGDGKLRYYKRVAAADNPNQKFIPREGEDPVEAAERRAKSAGFRASAWQETDVNGVILTRSDGKSDIIFCFPGFTTEDTTALQAIMVGGETNPQIHAVPAFINNTLDKIYGAERKNIGSAHVVGNSMGAANGLVAQRALIIGEVPHDELTLLEPFAVKLALDNINRELQSPESLLSQNIARFPMGSMLSTGAETIANPNMSEAWDHSYRMVVIGNDGKMKFSRTAMLMPVGNKANNEMVGQESLVDISGYTNITPGLPGIVDPLHMGANIAARLKRLNEAEIAAREGKGR